MVVYTFGSAIFIFVVVLKTLLFFVLFVVGANCCLKPRLSKRLEFCLMRILYLFLNSDPIWPKSYYFIL